MEHSILDNHVGLREKQQDKQDSSHIFQLQSPMHRRTNVITLLDYLRNDNISIAQAIKQSTTEEPPLEEGEKQSSVITTLIKKDKERGTFHYSIPPHYISIDEKKRKSLEGYSIDPNSKKDENLILKRINDLVSNSIRDELAWKEVLIPYLMGEYKQLPFLDSLLIDFREYEHAYVKNILNIPDKFLPQANFLPIPIIIDGELDAVNYWVFHPSYLSEEVKEAMMETVKLAISKIIQSLNN